MTANNKLLILFCAITAFGVGIAMNTARVSDQIDAQSVFDAQLIVSKEPHVVGSVNEHLGKLTLINFWASWCSPCREEMPIFETMYRQSNNNGFSIIGVAIDSEEKARPFLDSMDISYPILYAEKTGMQLMESAGNPQGLMPYSLLIDQQGNVIEQVLGKIDEQQIAAWLGQHLN